jgi:hypothetical protein
MRFRTSSQGNDRSVHWHQFSFLSGRTGRERKAGKFLMSSASDIAAAAAAVHGRPSLLQQVISCDDSVRWGAGAAHHIISLLHCSAYAPRARPGFQTTAMVVPAQQEQAAQSVSSPCMLQLESRHIAGHCGIWNLPPVDRSHRFLVINVAFLSSSLPLPLCLSDEACGKLAMVVLHPLLLIKL